MMYSEYRAGRMTPEPWVSTRTDYHIIRFTITPSSYDIRDSLFAPVIRICVPVMAPFALIDLPFAVVVDTLFLPLDRRLRTRAERSAEFMASALEQEKIDEAEFVRHWRDPYGRSTFLRCLQRRLDTGSLDKFPANIDRILLPLMDGEDVIVLVLGRRPDLSAETAEALFEFGAGWFLLPDGHARKHDYSYRRPRERALDELAANPATPESVLRRIAELPPKGLYERTDRWKGATLRNPRVPLDFLEWGAASDYYVWRSIAAAHTSATPEILVALANDTEWRVREAVARNTGTPAQAFLRLAGDPQPKVREAVARNAGTPTEALKTLAGDESLDIRIVIAGRPDTPPDVLARLAEDTAWNVRIAVAHNPAADDETLERLAGDDFRGVSGRARQQLQQRRANRRESNR